MPFAPDVCATIVPGRTAPVAASPEISPGSACVGHSQQKQFGAGGNLVNRQHRRVRQPALGTLARCVRYGTARYDDMFGALQCDAERSTHPTSGNNADREPRRAESVRGGPHRNHESTSLNV